MRLAPDLRPERYRLHLDVDPDRDEFAGEVTIAFSSRPGRRSVELHAVELEIDRVSLRDERGTVAVRRTTRREKRETLRLDLARTLHGSATLALSYRGPLRRDLRGLYLARSGERRYAATQLEAADARRMFPCFDEPDRKARFALSVTVPRKLQAVSNAAIESQTQQGASKTIRFRETPKLPTYLVALIVGELEASRPRRSGRTPIRVWHVPGKGHLTGFALQCASQALARLERYFDLPYPYDKLDLIAVPDFEFGAMENAGAVTFRESLLLLDPATATQLERKRMAEVIAHELAHMWFGDLVTMAWWDDLWLNEAFATWLAFAVVDDWKPQWQMWLDFQRDRSGAFALDGLVNTHPIYAEVRTPDQATENFDAITYEKGAAVVRMIEHWLGTATFRRGVRRYIRRHAESNARAQDLWRALEEASGRPVARVARAWIERPGFPIVAVRQLRRAGRGWLELSQERYFARPRGLEQARRTRWPIPLVMRVRGTRGRPRELRALITRSRERIELGAADKIRWVYANADEGGFYRPIHDPELLSQLGGDLERLRPAERMGLLEHQWAGVRANRAALPPFLELVDRLGGEECPEVLETALGQLAWLEDRVVRQLPESEVARFRTWLYSRFTPAFLALGWRARRSESPSERVRRAVLLRLAAGVARDPELLGAVEERIGPYLRDRASLEANLAGPVVDLAARLGDKSRYERYLRVMRRARTPQERTRFEHALGAFEDPALIERTLKLLLGDEVPTQDVVPVLVRLLGNPAAREASWTFIRERWDALSPRISPGLAARLATALPVLGATHRSEVAAFFRDHPLPAAERAMKQALETFALDAELRRRATPQLRSFLRAAIP